MNPSGPLRKEHRLIEKLLTLIYHETLLMKKQKRVNPVFIDTAVGFHQNLRRQNSSWQRGADPF